MDNEREKIIRTLMMRTTRRPLLFFDVEIVKHCNLNCRGCASLSPLADEEYLDLEEYSKDLECLSGLAEGEVSHINILGGEPLLHPQVNEFLRVARAYFPYGIIRLITNGILLGKMEDEFWKVCRDNDITVSPTHYPIAIDYKSLEKRAREENVRFSYFGHLPKYGGWVHTTLDLNGDRNEAHSFLHCWQANSCSVLDHGRLFPCPVIANSKYFNKHFNTNLRVSKRDYIDIYKVSSLEEIMDFFTRPVPFCRYCNTFKNQECDWGISKKNIDEWT